MANIEYQWITTEYPIRISEYANNLGINLRTLDYTTVPADMWNWIDGKIRSEIMGYLTECWEENATKEFSKVSQGVYVITLSDNLSIDYNGKSSQVIYIGRGQIKSRLKEHLALWIRDLSDSLQDIAFDVWMMEVFVRGNANAFKEVESDLLKDFEDRFGCLPLQNKKRGDYKEKEHDYCEDWNKPLKNPSKHHIKNGWSIKPLGNNPWAIMSFDDE
jgi:hypothetical protein